jgi:integrase
LGPPKTAASVRTVHLPAFLVTTLTEHRRHQHHEHVFTGADGGLLKRSNFRRRNWRPALVRAGLLGTLTALPTGEVQAERTDQRGHEHTQTLRSMAAAVTRISGNAADGIHFHDLRHTHKTWMIEDDVSEVAQCRRLGHKLAGIHGVYSRVTQPTINALLTGMQRRWEATNAPVREVTSTDFQ